MKRLGLLLLFVAMLSSLAEACTRAVGYFHQVTALRGRIVGKRLGLLQFRWLRQSFSVSDATLRLYEYRSPTKIEDLKQVAVVKTDSRGNFDFGPIAKGHYSLDISSKDFKGSDVMGDWFDVEVTDAVKATDSITIDVSPIRPDCTGGHEFIEKKTANATTH